MRYYVYPKGLNGELLAQVIRFFEPKSLIIFIDDSKSESSLEHYSKEGIDGKVLISSEKYYNQLSEKLVQLNIKEYENGLDYFAKEINAYLNKHIRKTRSVGILLRGLASEKHIGEIDQQLKLRDVDVVYICENERTLLINQERLKDKIAIIASHDLLTKINTISLFVTTNGGVSHDDVISLDLRHAFCEPLHFPYLQPKNYQGVLDSYMQSMDYICTSCDRTYHAMKANLKNLERKPKLLKAGSLSLDSYIKEVQSFNKTKENRKILLALKDVFNKEDMKRLCQAILEQEYEVLFRTHPDFFNSEDTLEIVKCFETNPLFIFDTEPTLSIENRVNSLCLITDYSSLGYTYPLSTGNPAIIYSPFKKEQTIHGYGFFDNQLHLRAEKIDDIVEYLKNISTQRVHFKTSISKYLDNEVFNVLRTEEYIVEQIIDIIEKRGSNE